MSVVRSRLLPILACCAGVALGGVTGVVSGGIMGSAQAQEPKSNLRLDGASAPKDAPGDAPSGGKSSQTERRDVDALLDALARAPDAETAGRLEQTVLQAWLASGSDTIDLLMERAMFAMEGKDYALALELLDAIVELKPDFAEGWNKRATLYYLIDDYDRSMRDIQKVLALEPRHFGALSGLGLILQDVGQTRGALAAFQQALAVHPFLGNIEDSVTELLREVEGDAI